MTELFYPFHQGHDPGEQDRPADESAENELPGDSAATSSETDQPSTDEAKLAKLRRRVKKYGCPATFGTAAIGSAIAPRFGILPQDAASNPYLLWGITAVCFIRGLVHVKQGNLHKYHRQMRGLTIANFIPATLLWALVASLAVRRPHSSAIPYLIHLATLVFWVVAVLQVIQLDKLRNGDVAGEDSYPDAEGGTAAVARLRLRPRSVTVEDVGRAAWCVGWLVRVMPGRRLSALVILVLTVNLNLGLSRMIDLGGHRTQLVAHSTGAGVTASLSLPPASRPVPPTSPSTSTGLTQSTAPTGGPPNDGVDHRPYDEVCNVNEQPGDADYGQEPGEGGPDWAADKLNRAWFGPGANVAGCAQSVHVIPDKSCPGAWEIGINSEGAIASVAIATKCRPNGEIFLGHAATIVQDMLANNLPMSGSCRRISGNGDIQLIYGAFGTIALVRPDRNIDSHIVELPPAVTAGWTLLMGKIGYMVWPLQASETTWTFQDSDGVNLGAVMRISVVGNTALAQTGLLAYQGLPYRIKSGIQSLDSATPGVARTCH